MSRHEEVRAAVDHVVDPCSNAMGLPLGLIEMGLAAITSIDDERGAVHVTMWVTSPCCAYAPTMASAVEAEVASLDWVRSVRVTIDPSVTWTEEAMSSAARAALRARRARTLALSGAEGFAWNKRAGT